MTTDFLPWVDETKILSKGFDVFVHVSSRFFLVAIKIFNSYVLQEKIGTFGYCIELNGFFRMQSSDSLKLYVYYLIIPVLFISWLIWITINPLVVGVTQWK